MPDEQRDFIELNARLSQEWPSITEAKDPPADADDWVGKPDKRKYL